MQQPQRRPPTMQERWAALAGQQQAVIVLATVAVILMIFILILLVSGGSDDDNDDVAVVPTATNTPTIIEVTSTPEPTEEVEPTLEPEPEPTETPEPTPEPEPTETPEPTPEPTEEPTEEPEPTETPEPEPTETPEPEPTATPEPEPTPVPEALSGEVRVEDPEGDVRSTEGEEPPAALPMVDLRAVELDFDDDDEIEVRFFLNDNVPSAIDPGIVLTWTLIIWIGEGENYRLSVQLEQDDWTVTLVDSTTGDEFILDIEPDLDNEELRLEIPRAPVERLIEPFTWAATATLETGDGQVFGDNLPDAGDTFNLEPGADQRSSFPE